jgi:hypothetical protein
MNTTLSRITGEGLSAFGTESRPEGKASGTEETDKSQRNRDENGFLRSSGCGLFLCIPSLFQDLVP